MKSISKNLIAGVVFAVASSTSLIAQCTVSTPCGEYTVADCVQSSSKVVTSGNSTATVSSNSSSVSVSSSTSNGVTSTEIYVNGKLYKKVTCEATESTPVKIKPFTFPSFGDFFKGFSFPSFPSFPSFKFG
ncbi:hypothetical protein ATE84_0196 [Aquimarina sp. MAR_2010_214]|uniref:hypothetical protein n=1 Tax=Aquimarina sp. MAR_2010_214 TaxID=1250026 RepID=UPI000C708932|nr:hypothetical protein [Aquimarina sp. MAR_2010_214]PKV48203.1 hypothetical protein ATE84_0196 [Aquimarina sp. MAR_2010_214]